jgi:membrane protein implicated in regulation of membrane protease activity
VLPTIVRYVLFQIPGWIIAAIVAVGLAWQWPALPAWLSWGLVGAWIGKDLLLYPFVRKAYERGRSGLDRLVGSRGIATGALDPAGYVLVRGELWRAEADAGPIAKGSAITVRAARGLTLIVGREDA